MSKQILYLDMDGVVADFDLAIREICPELDTDFPEYESRSKKVDEIVKNNPLIFHNLKPYHGAIHAVNILSDLYDIYFLSTPMWNIPESFSGKRIWFEKYFGEKATKRLILTHRKDLNIGHFLVDDRLKNGASNFTGQHIHFRTNQFPDWNSTLIYLLINSNMKLKPFIEISENDDLIIPPDMEIGISLKLMIQELKENGWKPFNHHDNWIKNEHYPNPSTDQQFSIVYAYAQMLKEK